MDLLYPDISVRTASDTSSVEQVSTHIVRAQVHREQTPQDVITPEEAMAQGGSSQEQASASLDEPMLVDVPQDVSDPREQSADQPVGDQDPLEEQPVSQDIADQELSSGEEEESSTQGQSKSYKQKTSWKPAFCYVHFQDPRRDQLRDLNLGNVVLNLLQVKVFSFLEVNLRLYWRQRNSNERIWKR